MKHFVLRHEWVSVVSTLICHVRFILQAAGEDLVWVLALTPQAS